MYALLLFTVKLLLLFFLLKFLFVFAFINLLFVCKMLNSDCLYRFVSVFILVINKNFFNFFTYYEIIVFCHFIFYYSYAVVLFFWFLYFRNNSTLFYLKHTCLLCIVSLKFFYFFDYKFIKTACALLCVGGISFFFASKSLFCVVLFFVLIVFFSFISNFFLSTQLNFILSVELFCLLIICISQANCNFLYVLSFTFLKLLSVFDDEVILLTLYNNYDDLNHFIGDYEDSFLLFWFNIVFDNCDLTEDYDFVDFSFNDFEDDDVTFLNFWMIPPFKEFFFHYNQNVIYKWNDLEKVVFMLNSIFKFFY